MDFVVIIEGSVTLKHHSTSSLVELQVYNTEEKQSETIWLDYYDFENLKKAIEQADGKGN